MAAPEASASWGSQLELAADPPQEEDVLVLDYGDDEECASDLLISEDEDEDDIFMTPARAAQPAASVASRDGDEGSTPASPLPSSDMLDVCKRAAARLAIPWPAVVAETTRSRYKGKKLPLARSATKQLLPIFPELLVEVARPHARSNRLAQEILGPGCGSAGTARAGCLQPGQEEEESGLTAPLSTGDAAGSSPFASSTGLAFERAPRGPPRPHLPATTDRAGVYREELTFDGGEFSGCPSLMSTSTHTNQF